MNTLDMSLEIKKILLTENLNVTKLAEILGKKRQTLNTKFLKNNFTVEEILNIADVLDYDVEINFKKRKTE